MTVDMTKIQVGDTVHFRCGGSAVISAIAHVRPWGLVFKDISDGCTYSYNSEGKNSGIWPHLLDITSITPRALTPEERLAKIAAAVDARCPSWKEHPPGGWLPEIMRLARGEP